MSTAGSIIDLRRRPAWLALAALLSLATGAARGEGCGDRHRAGMSGFEALGRYLGDGGEPSTPVPACSGPSCSQSPAMPPASTAGTPRFVELWACLGAVDGDPAGGSSRLVVRPMGNLPVRRGVAIFHPPR